MTHRQCPECRGVGTLIEPMDKFERKEFGTPRTTAWESRCKCCRGRGYILFDMMYPTATEFKGAYKDWMNTEVIPQMEAQMKRMKDPVYTEELKQAVAENLKRTTAKRNALVARLKKAMEKAVKKVERM